tara:strand:- start:7976 stop:8230 length:255 start_codon:yes stop_codon:yes gene_type:complete
MVYYKMTELSIEHVLLFIVAAFLLYHLMGSCGCGDGFSVGGQPRMAVPKFMVIDDSCDKCKSMCNCLPATMFSGASGCNKCLDI